MLLRVSMYPAFVPWFVMCCLIHVDLSNKMRGQKRYPAKAKYAEKVVSWLLPDCVNMSTHMYVQRIRLLVRLAFYFAMQTKAMKLHRTPVKEYEMIFDLF